MGFQQGSGRGQGLQEESGGSETGQRGEFGVFKEDQLVLKDKSSLSPCPPVPLHVPGVRTLCPRAVLSDRTESHPLLHAATHPSEKNCLLPLPVGPPLGRCCPHCVEVEKGMGQGRAPESPGTPDTGNSGGMCCSLVTFALLPGCPGQ